MYTIKIAMKKICLILFLSLVFFAGNCQKTPPKRQWEVGDFHPIGGKRYTLPKGLEVDSIIGEIEQEIPSCEWPLAFYVKNTTQKRISVTMPEGLVFTPQNTEYSYMILVQRFSFSVPAAETTILLPTYQTNEMLDEPDEESKYDIDIQVWEKELCELFDLLKDKVIDAPTEVDLVQEALYEITEEVGELTDSTREALKNLQ